jgi:hypothetical protein
MNLEPHEPTTACADYHCFWHNIDEPTEGYRLCYECMHMYPTEAELIGAYWDAFPEDTPLIMAPLSGATITFCPLCSHDF